MGASAYANWPAEIQPRKAQFEMALRLGVDDAGLPFDTYEFRACWLVGALAVHRAPQSDWQYAISHAATGLKLPCAYGRTLKEACRVARALNGAIDWSAVTRSRCVLRPKGLTREAQQAIVSMIYSFSFLRPLVDEERAKQAGRPR